MEIVRYEIPLWALGRDKKDQGHFDYNSLVCAKLEFDTSLSLRFLSSELRMVILSSVNDVNTT